MNPFFGSTNTNMFSDFDFLSNDQQQRQEVASSAEEDFYHSRPARWYSSTTASDITRLFLVPRSVLRRKRSS
ncbi:hypothetical protein FRC15_006224 [Serendipita sp. 397]|nr:hypothetical protein FRC15_006224 [Serendipita sp. 397]